jgi:hypothetical protein
VEDMRRFIILLSIPLFLSYISRECKDKEDKIKSLDSENRYAEYMHFNDAGDIQQE